MRIVLVTIGFVGAGLLGAVFGQVLFSAQDVLPKRSEDYSRLTAQVEDYGNNLKAEVLKVVSIDQYEAIVRWSEDKRKQAGQGNR